MSSSSAKSPLDALPRTTRRELLKRFGAMGLAGSTAGGLGLNLAAMSQASAAVGSSYRALVCVFLYGGNDAYNTVLATDSASWANYAAARSASNNALVLGAAGTPADPTSTAVHTRLGGVLPINPVHAQGRTLALHPAMTEVAALFNKGRAGVVANVGPLVAPLTKAQYMAGTGQKPVKLFSHNDQQSTWQSLATEGATAGWGGRMADQLLSGNGNSMFTATSIYGNAVWLAGQQARAYQLSQGGAIRIGSSSGAAFGSTTVQQKLVSLMSSSRNNSVLEREYAAVVGRSATAEGTLRNALPAMDAGPWGSSTNQATDALLMHANPSTGAMAVNPLAQQLQAVARMIAARQTLGVSRQVFFVGIGGFDTHDTQPDRHALALARLSHGLGYFDKALQAMGVDDGVTTFTASDFGRNLSSNGDGVDHGWGAHHFVMGGAVRGGDVYGTLPVYGKSSGNGVFDSPDQLSQGALLPSMPVERYAATMGRWLGLSDAQLLDMLPRLGNWSAADRTLGFLG